MSKLIEVRCVAGLKHEVPEVHAKCADEMENFKRDKKKNGRFLLNGDAGVGHGNGSGVRATTD